MFQLELLAVQVLGNTFFYHEDRKMQRKQGNIQSDNPLIFQLNLNPWHRIIRP
jgi:hypothetical protein